MKCCYYQFIGAGKNLISHACSNKTEPQSKMGNLSIVGMWMY